VLMVVVNDVGVVMDDGGGGGFDGSGCGCWWQW
jgi:hypothetical protein